MSNLPPKPIQLARAVFALVGTAFLVQLAYAGETPIRAGDRIATTVDNAPVKSGVATLLTLPKGTQLTAEEIDGDWVKVTVKQGDNKKITGWIYAKHAALAPEPRSTWETVSKSNDIVQYADYVKEHPDHHTVEIKKLVTVFFHEKLAKAKRQGKNIIPQAQTIPADVGGGTTFVLGGGQIELGPVKWYSDPTDSLTVKSLDGFQYVKGRGIGIIGDKVYCFGMRPDIELSQPEKQGIGEATKSNPQDSRANIIPAEFIGDWAAREGAAGKLVVDKTSIIWEREGEEKTVVTAQKCRVLDKGHKVTFQVEEVAFRNILTGEAPKRPVDVELSLEGKKLKIVVSPTQTRVSPSSPLVVTSPARTYVYGRESP